MHWPASRYLLQRPPIQPLPFVSMQCRFWLHGKYSGKALLRAQNVQFWFRRRLCDYGSNAAWLYLAYVVGGPWLGWS
jgi:hypothetical protein